MASHGTGRTAASFRPVRLLSRKTVILLPRATSFAAKFRGAFVKIVLVAAVAHGSPKSLLSNPLVTESIVVRIIIAISLLNIFPKMSVGASHGIPPTVRTRVDIAFRTNHSLRFGNSGLCLGFREERIEIRVILEREISIYSKGCCIFGTLAPFIQTDKLLRTEPVVIAVEQLPYLLFNGLLGILFPHCTDFFRATVGTFAFKVWTEVKSFKKF